MSRRPDVPCASCGKLMWRGTGSLPAGEAQCRDCRRADIPACVDCGARVGHNTQRCGPCHLAQLERTRNPRPRVDELHTQAWRRLRAQVLAEEPECGLRFPGICTGTSDTAGHIELITDRPDLILTRSNVRGVCRRCNHARRLLPNALLVLPMAGA